MIVVSPDGLLQQSSTVADSSLFTFADGKIESIPRSYIEFAERLRLPQFKDLQDEEVCIIFSNSYLLLLHDTDIEEYHLGICLSNISDVSLQALYG
jgi:hypothetical protein